MLSQGHTIKTKAASGSAYALRAEGGEQILHLLLLLLMLHLDMYDYAAIILHCLIDYTTLIILRLSLSYRG